MISKKPVPPPSPIKKKAPSSSEGQPQRFVNKRTAKPQFTPRDGYKVSPAKQLPTLSPAQARLQALRKKAS